MANDPWERKTPPEGDEDWAFLFRGAHLAHEAWAVVGPMVAAIRNWKAWAVAVVLFVWMNRPDIFAALQTLVGGG